MVRKLAFLLPAALFAVLLSARGKMRREGDLLKLYLVLYGVCRFLLEFVRERDLMFGGLSLVQWVCLLLMAVFSLELCLANRRSLSTMRLED
jgi:prolipoprotein diacylglyceryltransferase